MDKIIESKCLTIKEAAQILGISTATVHNWARHGYFTPFKENKGLLFDYNEVINIKNKVANGVIKRLDSRANKKNSSKTFLPDEYFNKVSDIPLFNKIKGFITDNTLIIEESIFTLSLNMLISEGIIGLLPITLLFKFNKTNCPNAIINHELSTWHKGLNFNNKEEIFEELLTIEIPKASDFLGTLYQSLLSEGDKSKGGSYYTPANITGSIAEDYIGKVDKNLKILDPCCGTGQFLLSAADAMLNNNEGEIIPENIWGYDIDKIALQIARINILIKFKDYVFTPNIHHLNLIESYSTNKKSSIPKDFDLIMGNPPWGAEVKIEQMTFLKNKFPKILTLESFSYFIYIGLKLLKNEGILAFILPEAIINIKSHKDIRSYILKESDILQIQHLGRIFKNVFTPVIRLDLKKTVSQKRILNVSIGEKKYQLNSSRFNSNANKIFDIYNTPEDQKIIDKTYSADYVTLKDKTDWALGIVTGDNEKFISKEKKEGYEEIYKGKDVFNFYLNPNIKSYIKLEPEKFQQTPPISKYRVDEKLIYRFISKKLVFAYDDAQKVTLNSANILIPKIENYPIKVILALLNSSLYQFIFQKKFFTHKVLRFHLEQLPLPLLNKNALNDIIKITNRLINPGYDKVHREKIFKDLNNLVFNLFKISEEETSIILSQI